MTQDATIFQVNLSFKNNVDMTATQIGEDAYNDEVLAAPISWIPYRNVIDERVIPKTPDNANNKKSLWVILAFDFRIEHIESMIKNKIGNRTVFATMTPINLSPKETRIIPTAVSAAVPRAIRIPLNLSLSTP